MKKNIIYLLSNLGKTTSDVNVVVARFMLMTKTSRLKLKLQLFQFGDVNATMDVIGKKCRKNAAQKILDDMKKSSTILVSQAVMISDELIRTAMLLKVNF